ncbi:hypothetical protein HanOQP8_Chr04g0159671 [Helianthus annuus]|nr:hypothetical protein HanOQP8_Chr04g0159671 [Helianthus annuus]
MLHKRQKDQEDQHMKRKVSRLSESFNAIKDVNLQFTASTARELTEDPLKYVGSSKRWKSTRNYGDIGFKYRDDQTIAYVASRMSAVFSACQRVLTEKILVDGVFFSALKVVFLLFA